MRPPHAFWFLVVAFLASCTAPGDGPTNPLTDAPTVQMSHVGDLHDELCRGLSPCDAYHYGRTDQAEIGTPGICFLPPTVDNHTSDPACSAPNARGLDGVFQLAWCEVDYTAAPAAPDVLSNCQDEGDWPYLKEGGGFYSADVRFPRRDRDKTFRIYVVLGEQILAHRDVVVNPNLTTPADGYVHAIGFGKEPIKVSISDEFACYKYDTQGNTPENAATCLIVSGTVLALETNDITTVFTFDVVETPFQAEFEVSECEQLTESGTPLVDVPLASCKIGVESLDPSVQELASPAQIQVLVEDARWNPGGVFENARLNVLQYDEQGIAALPPAADPGWFGDATSSSAALRFLDWGLDKLAGLFMPEPLLARIGSTWDYRRMSDFQVAVMPVMDGVGGVACSTGEAYCTDLGSFDEGASATVQVHVAAPSSAGQTDYPTDHFDVPGARLHIFEQTGTVSCPGSGPGTCVPANGTDTSGGVSVDWGHVVVITDANGDGAVSWTPEPGENTLHVVACGIARPGTHEPDPPGEPSGNVWGDLGDCTDRDAARQAGDGAAYDNGPADGFTPFEPVDTDNEVAIYGRPLEFRASVCGAVVIDGTKDAVWDACADKTVFTAPVQGPTVPNNATLYTYRAGDSLYVAVEVATSNLGNRIFVNLTESATGGDGVEAPGDDLLLIDDVGDASEAFADWHLTQQCIDNNAASLCGAVDTGSGNPSAAGAAGSGSGTVFYEFKRPFGDGGTPKEDLAAGSGDEIALRVTVTQGQGGGKGGFVFPDPQTSSSEYHVFTIQ